MTDKPTPTDPELRTPSDAEIIMLDVESGVSVRAGKGAVKLAGAVPMDEARRLFDAGWKAAALFCDRDDVVADGIIGFGACPQFEAAFSAAYAHSPSRKHAEAH